MRLIASFSNSEEARRFSASLTERQIGHQVETHTDTDWGSTSYGDTKFDLWIGDEDQVGEAVALLELFREDPGNEKFKTEKPKHPSLTTAAPAARPAAAGEEPPPLRSLGPLTTLAFALCAFLFALSYITQPQREPVPASLPTIAIFAPPIVDELLFDFPRAYELLHLFVERYGAEGLSSPATLPPGGLLLLKEYQQTPYWQGFYQVAVDWLRDPHKPMQFNAPLFEKIGQGEVWRLFTPCLLHFDFLHIFFNMVWLLILGPKIEKRAPWWGYLFLIVVSAILSNTVQYLMSGPNFIGFSGVVCAMIAFIWARQRYAPWEGYQVSRSTFLFIGAFIGAIALLQLGSFLLEVFGLIAFSPGVANTAHLVGALTGYLIGRSRLLAWRLRA